MASGCDTVQERSQQDCVSSSLTRWSCGVCRVKSVEGLAEDCSIMFAMLADDAAVRDVFAAVLRGEPPPSAIFADMSTVLPSTTAELAAAAADKGALIAGSESNVQFQMDGCRWTKS